MSFPDSGRSNGFHSGLAQTLDTYVWDRFVTDSSALGHYIFVASEKDKAVELQNKVDKFKDRLMTELIMDMRFKQGLVFVSDTGCPTCLICGIRCHSGWCEVWACSCCKYSRWAVGDPCLTFVKWKIGNKHWTKGAGWFGERPWWKKDPTLRPMYARHPPWHLTKDRNWDQEHRWPQFDLNKRISWSWKISLGS